MRRAALDSVNCSIAQTLDVVGDPWTLLIIRDALWGVTRFDEFRRSLAIPRATLSTRLRDLVDHGVLEQRPVDEGSSRSEYVLTRKGRDLGPVLVAMLQWGDTWAELPAPPITLVDSTTDEPLDLTYVDQTSGRRLRDIPVGRRVNTNSASAAEQSATR
ncbi:MAG: helix-turn-helix domain-containing protein [Actinomycetota bacterium]